MKLRPNEPERLELEERFEAFYTIDKEKGTITSKLVGNQERVFILSSTGWSLLVKKIRSSFDNGADVILFEMGQYYGSSLALRIKKYEMDYNKSVSDLLRTASYSGWGKISATGDLQSGKGIQVTVENCVFCADRHTTSASCHFFKGVIAGVADVLYGHSFKVVERKCRATGADCCEFAFEEDPYGVYELS